MLIRLNNGSISYMRSTPFETEALKNVSLEVRGSEAIGIIGPTGSGKSTLGQAMAGLMPLDSGSLHINNMAVPDELRVSKAYQYVSFLFQKPEKQLFEATVYDEVAFGCKNLGWPKDKIAHSVKNALESVGLDFEEFRNRSPFNLSGGEMRRVGIASVIALGSPALIMDEPTAGLDPQGKRLMINFLKNLKSENRALVLISHDLDEVLNVCDRIIVLNKGQVAVACETKDILSHLAELDELGLYMPENYTLGQKLNEWGYEIASFEREDILKAVEARLSG